MAGWDPKRPEAWADLFGLVIVPMFASHQGLPIPPKGVHSLMLDGSRGSFLLSTAGPKNLIGGLDPVRWAWSANVSHAVAISDSGRAIVRRWDYPESSKEWPILNEREAGALFRSLEQSSQPPSAQSVIARGLHTFRAIRIAIEKQGGSAEDVVLAFNTLLAWVASYSDSERDAEISFEDAVRVVGNRGQIGFTAQQISPRLRSFPLGNLARLLRQGDEHSAQFLLDADLLIRHASGPLYQEAHKQLLLPADRAIQEEMFPREMLIVGTESPRGPVPAFVHHTPPSLARALVEIALRFLEFEAHDQRLSILDPASGSGVFLIEALREVGLQKSLPQVVSFMGFDQSKLAIVMADFCLRNANPANRDHTVTLQWQNSLAVDDWGTPQIIAMNPPFMAWEDLSSDERDVVQLTLGPLHKGRPDLAFAFIVRALKSLKPGGVLASLVPPSFLEGQSADAIRAYIQGSDEFQIRLIGHFNDFDYFDAAVEPSFIVVSRSTRGSPIQIITAKSGFADNAIRALRFGKSISKAGYELYTVNKGELSSHRWTPKSQLNLQFVEALTANTSQTVADFFIPRLGIRTGNKSVFIVAENDLNRICPSKKERRFFRPVADKIESGQIKRSNYVFYPYDDTGTLLLSTEEQVKATVPHFYNERLGPAKNALKNRKSLYRNWWEVTEPVATWLAPHTPRIVSQAFGHAENFAFDKRGEYAVVQGVGWCWKLGNPDESTMLSYLAIVNSAIFNELLPSFCPRVRGGQYNLSRQFIERVPLPRLTEESMRALSEVGHAIIDGREHDKDMQNSLVLSAYGIVVDNAKQTEPKPFATRIDKLAELRDGWFGPDSPRLDPVGLIKFRTFMNRVLSRGRIPTPYLYPTPQGGAQAEWSFPSWEVSASVSLSSGALHLHATHLESDLSRDVETTLAAPGAIETLLEFMAEFTD